VAALVIGVALIGFLAFNSWQTVHDVQNAQSNHSQTLNAIKADAVKIDALANQIHQYQVEQGQGNSTVGQILREAGAEVTALQASQHAICVAVHANC
jgi:heme/copper-type cytochrome/quinol oxidase subunit 2